MVIKQLSGISIIDDSDLELDMFDEDAKVYGLYTSKIKQNQYLN